MFLDERVNADGRGKETGGMLKDLYLYLFSN